MFGGALYTQFVDFRFIIDGDLSDFGFGWGYEPTKMLVGLLLFSLFQVMNKSLGSFGKMKFVTVTGTKLNKFDLRRAFRQ